MTTTQVTELRRAYRVEEVAEMIGVSRSTAWRLLASGALESIKVGGSRRITADQLDRFLAAS